LRRLIDFACAGETLAGTLDEGSATTGLLIVSGGNEIRIGAHRGMASLAARLAKSGTPVFRFDRRGIGDSTGTNFGFLESAPDIAAAAATFSAETGIKRLVAFGNCDAATALALFQQVAGIDALILANPWIVEQSDDLPSAAAIRARYAARLRDPTQWLRLLRGEVDLRKLSKGLRKSVEKQYEDDSGLAARFIAALAASTLPVTIVLARRDSTAIAFEHAVASATIKASIHVIDTASHSFAREGDQAELEAIIRAALA
jgi:exosortase A-associated hydrolase 1